MAPLSLALKEVAKEKSETKYHIVQNILGETVASALGDYFVFTEHNCFYTNSERKTTWLPLDCGQVLAGLF